MLRSCVLHAASFYSTQSVVSDRTEQLPEDGVEAADATGRDGSWPLLDVRGEYALRDQGEYGTM